MPAASRRSRVKRVAIIWLGVAVSAVFAYLAVRNVQFGEVWAGVREGNYWWLVPAFIALGIANLLRAYRWELLFEPNTRPSFPPTLSAMLLGQFFNNVLPARAGEAARVVALNQSCGTSRVEAAGTVISERAWDVLTLLIILFAAVPWLPHVAWLRTAVIVAIVLASGLALVFFVLIKWAERPLVFLLRPLSRFRFLSTERIAKAAANLVRGLGGLHRGRLALFAFVLSVVSWLVLALSGWFVLRGSHLDLSFGAALLACIAVSFGMTLPSSPASVGVFEAATIVALRAYHISDSKALSYALVLHALNYLPYIVAGLLILQAHAISVRRRDSVSADTADEDVG